MTASFRFRPVTFAVLSAFLFSADASAASFQLPSGCASLGGALGEDGVCRIVGNAVGSAGWNATITVAEDSGGLIIQGSDDYGTPGLMFGASDRQKFNITNNSAGDVVFEGGAGAYSDGAIEIAGADYTIKLTPVPGKAVFTNNGSGRFVFEAGEGLSSNGVYSGSSAGGNWKLTNSGSGSILFSGGYGVSSEIADSEWPEQRAGMFVGADAGTTDITNDGTGAVTIIGSTGGNSFITEEAASFGIGTGASFDGEFYLRQLGTGSTLISGGTDSFSRGINIVACEASALIGTAAGSMTIRGGSAVGADGIGSGSVEGLWYLLNTEGASMKIEGGTASEAHGIRQAALDGGETIIGNTGGGSLEISGGSASGAHGIAAMTAAETAEAVLINEEGGVLTISGGTATGAHGIGVMALTGSAYLGNDEGSVLRLAGTPTAPAIGTLNATATGCATIENAGLMVMNSNAIGSFGEANADGSKLFYNDRNAILEAPVGLLFNGGSVAGNPTTAETVVKFVSADGTEISKHVTVSGTDYLLTADSLSVKPDWAEKAEFSEGSTVRFTDVTLGSAGEVLVREAFEAAFGTGVNLDFALPVASRQPAFSEVSALIAAYPGAVFYETDLDTEGHPFSVTAPVGLRSVSGAKVTVAAGGELTLLGNGEKAAAVPIDVVEGGILRLGTENSTLTASNGGRLTRIINGGVFIANSGAFTVEVLRNSGSAVIEPGASLTLTGTGGRASEIGDLTNAGTLVVSGQISSGNLTNAGGRLKVEEGASVHLTTVSGGKIENQGVLIADRAVSADISTAGLTDLPGYAAGIGTTLSVPAGGTLLAETFNSVGVVRASQGSLVIGSAAKTRYLLEHLDEARALVDAGATVDDSVLEALGVNTEGDVSSTTSTSATGSSLALRRPATVPEVGEKTVDENESVATFALRGSPSEVLAVEAGAEEGEEVAVSSEVDSEAVSSEEGQEESETDAASGAIEPGPATSERPTAALSKADRSRVQPSLTGANVFAAWDAARDDASALSRASADRTTGLTAELLTGMSEIDAYRVKRNGVRVGLQRADNDLTLGVQAAYGDGKVKFGAERSRTDASFGVYGRYRLGDAFVSGFAGYGHGRAEVQEASDVSTDSLFGGFILGADVTVSDITVTPHVGMTANRIKTDDASDVRTLEFPIGFSVAGTLLTASGWTLKPNADLSFVVQTGDRTVGTVESDLAVDSIFTGRHRTEASIGLNADKDGIALELRIAGLIGDEGFKSTSGRLRAIYAF